jgi:hypothetical protein
MTAAGRRLAQAMTAAMETIQLGLVEIERRPVDHTELRILVPATLSMHWLVPRLPQIEQADLGFRLCVHTTHTGEDWLSLAHDAAIRRNGFLPLAIRTSCCFRKIDARRRLPNPEGHTTFGEPHEAGRIGSVAGGMQRAESKTGCGKVSGISIRPTKPRWLRRPSNRSDGAYGGGCTEWTPCCPRTRYQNPGRPAHAFVAKARRSDHDVDHSWFG